MGRILAFLLALGVSASGVEIFSTNSVWRFRMGTSEVAAGWRAVGFNDAAAGFVDAAAPFWYGDARTGGTLLSDMPGAYTCVYLRKGFVIGKVSEVGSLRLRAFVDDGLVAWINGVEVARTNVGPVQPTYLTTATNALEPVPLFTYALPLSSLVSGTNILTVQAFNVGAASSDFGFDGLLDVTIVEGTPPVIAEVLPAAGTVGSLDSIAVTFSEPVVGVSADDFLINGVPATSMSGSGNRYEFRFTQPLLGAVWIGWAAGHGIMDLATPGNAFNGTGAGATWQYNLVDITPPTVAGLYPPAGLRVRSLSQVEVRFSEPVTGVNAGDLRVNGQGATGLVHTPADSYVFSFPAAGTGSVQVAWGTGHGITDTAAVPNAFAGGSWNYVVDPGSAPADLVINEFLAANVSTNGLKDEDGEQQDWIEIYNRGVDAVNLENWSLSDDATLPGLWTFPKRTLGPNSYLVVFASGKDRRSTNAAARLHTNFKLGAAGEHLGLYTPEAPRMLLDGFGEFPEQRNDISYGRDVTNALRYFATPTPGWPNGVSLIVGACETVHANIGRGHYSHAVDLVLSCPTPGAELRYTTDGSEPTLASALFPGKLTLSMTTLLRAAAFKANYLPSETLTRSYFFNLPPAWRSLPVISIVTSTNHLYGPNGILGIEGGTYASGAWAAVSPGDYHNPSKHGLAWERPTSVEWIEPGDNSGFQVECGIRVQGSDWQRPRLTTTSKFSFRLYFRSDYGPGRLEYPLFPLTSVGRFDQLVLRAGFNEQGNPFIRDEIHRRLSHDMGGIASHGTVAVVFINGTAYGGSPWYNPAERVHEEFFQEHLGGGPEWDVVGPAWAQGASLPGVIDGDRADFQNLVNYVNTQPASSSVVYTFIGRRLDLTNFVDYCILNSFAAMGDWPGNNWRAGRDRTNSVWRFVVWDAEWGMGIYGRGIDLNSFTQTGGGPQDSGLGSSGSSEIAQIYNRLKLSPEFRLLWADRVHKHFFNGGALTGLNISNRFNELRGQLEPLMGPMETTILTWAQDRQAIYFPQMQVYGLVASSNAPVFSQFGGRAARGYPLTMSNSFGSIYYTTNGTDPRVAFTGAVSPSAILYSGPVVLGDTVPIRARSYSGGGWSAVTEATFTVGTLGVPLRITELMYNPAGGSLHEYLELQNTSGAAVDLGGMYFDGITFAFKDGSILAGGARLVLGVNTDTNAWKAVYPGVTPAGWFSGNLNNAGERLTLFDRWGGIITSVQYDDEAGWPLAADGGGRSLEVVNVNGSPDEPANWQASGALNGSPGVENSPVPARAVELNEVMAENLGLVNHEGTFPDWVELRNTGGATVNLAGWSLSDDGNVRKYVFPPVTIPGNGHLVVWCDDSTNTTAGLHTGFSLNREGETVSLYDASGTRVDALTFGSQVGNYSVGRIDGDWRLTVATTNAANMAAMVASSTNLVINEWLANPATGYPDWLELFNGSGSAPVSLQGLYLTTSNQLHHLLALSFLPPLGYVQLFADEQTGADHLNFKLSASGERLTLWDPTGSPVQSVTYGPQSEGVSQGRYPNGSGAIVSFPMSVSPGAANYVLTWTGPVLNEVLARNQTVNVGGRMVDYVELRNPAVGSFDLGGMSLSVNRAQAGEWVFPPGTILGGNGYLLVRCDGSRPASTMAGNFNTGESLDGESGGVYLFNGSGQLVNSVEYGPQAVDLPLGWVNGQWRLLAAASPGTANGGAAVLGSSTALRINEWMAETAYGADWFELFNTTNRPVALGGIALSDDPSIAGQSKFTPAPLSFIAPGGFVKWVADGDAGEGRNHVNFALSGAGETILVYATNGGAWQMTDGVTYGAESPGVSRGSLPDGSGNRVSFAGSASPGASNYRLLQSVVINEALAHTDPPLEDAVELHNPTASPVNIGGWFLSNSKVVRRKYQVPAGTTIDAGGYAVIYEYQFNNGTSNAFSLDSAHGDELWLSAAMGGVETGDRTGVAFGASSNGVAFGRVVTSSRVDFAALTQRTFGKDLPSNVAEFRGGRGGFNAAPAVGPVIVNEIMYHPAGGTNGSTEYVELRNNTAGAVTLYDPLHATNQWRLGGAVDYTFPSGQSLAAGGHVLVVDFDPALPTELAEFRTRYGISAAVPVYGPFAGNLANDTDSVELFRPDTPQPASDPDAGFVPYLLVDRVSYADAAPWPAELVDGGGLSLHRRGIALYGNEPLNWMAGFPTPGRSEDSTADTDGDGIPDAAEDAMNLDRYNPGDAGLDADGDGATNLEEYLAGTDHLNADSALRLTRIVVGAEVTLIFEAVANKSYSVIYQDALTDGAWVRLVDVAPSAASGTRTVTDTSASRPARFYRLVTPAAE